MGKFNETNFSPEFMALLGGGATHEQAEEILAAIAAIDMSSIDLSAIGSPSTAASNTITSNAHSKLNWLLSVLETVNTNLGAPATVASNATSAVAHAKLNWLLSTLATVNTNTATANLGAPATAASNATSSVAHAKLNWLMSTLATVSSNSSNSGSVGTVMTLGTYTGSGGNLSTGNPSYHGASLDLSTTVTTVNGKGRLLFLIIWSNMSFGLNIDGKYSILGNTTSNILTFDLQKMPFSSSFKLTSNSSLSASQYRLVYEAN